MKKNPKRLRKPKLLQERGAPKNTAYIQDIWGYPEYQHYIHVNDIYIRTDDAKRLAAWLIRAVDWIESREK